MISEHRALLSLVRPHRAALASGAALMAAESGFALALPYFGGRVAEEFLRRQDVVVGATLAALLAVITAQALLRFANVYLLGRTAHRFLADLRTRMYAHLQTLPMAYFNDRRRGDVLSVLATDTWRIGTYISSTLAGVVSMVLTLFGSVYFMWRIDATLALLAVAAIPLFYLVIKVLGRKVRPLATALNEAHWQAFARAEENLGLITIIKAFNRQPLEAERYAQMNETIRSLEDRELWHSGGLSPAVQWLAGVAVLIVLWLAADRVAAQSLGAGALVTFLLYASLMTRPVSALADLYGQTQSVRAALTRVEATLAEAPEAANDRTNPLAVRRERSERFEVQMPTPLPRACTIEFRNVSFAYPNRPPVLSDFNLRIEAGETIALTGENGAGKSTLVHLLLRFITPQSGQIFVDDVEIQQIDLQTLRARVGFVPQHVQLLNGTIRENIAYGRPDAAEEAIIAAAKAGQAHAFITALPEGYNTIIGDQGVRLSGGQRQRVALARALLVDPPILVLDEATSMFDNDSESAFIANCTDTLATKTVLLITHRPAALALATRQVVMT
jgi:subfamily B ATP-binding cassette protein MsbA